METKIPRKVEMLLAIEQTMRLHEKALAENRPYVEVRDDDGAGCPLCHFDDDGCKECPWEVFRDHTCRSGGVDGYYNSRTSLLRLQSWKEQVIGQLYAEL